MGMSMPGRSAVFFVFMMKRLCSFLWWDRDWGIPRTLSEWGSVFSHCLVAPLPPSPFRRANIDCMSALRGWTGCQFLRE